MRSVQSAAAPRVAPLRTIVTTMVGIGLVLAAMSAADADPKERKLDRQIGVFERIMDDMLVDSPNFLVQNSEVAYGVYVDGRGVTITFPTSLVDSDWGWDDGGWKWWKGRHFVIVDEDEEGEDDDDDSDRRRVRRMSRKDRDKERAEEVEFQAKRYEEGKAEIIDTLLMHGDLFTTLGDDEWLEVTARLKRADYFRENDLRRLVVRAKLGDIRAFADEKISEKAMFDRIVVKES